MAQTCPAPPCALDYTGLMPLQQPQRSGASGEPVSGGWGQGRVNAPLIREQGPLNKEARAPAGTPVEPLSKQLPQRAGTVQIIAWAGGWCEGAVDPSPMIPTCGFSLHGCRYSLPETRRPLSSLLGQAFSNPSSVPAPTS